VLGAILGSLAESYFLTAMISAENDWTIFFVRPASLALIVLSAVTVALSLSRPWRQ
jgi:putative tricarboxylic transport membrane protein